VALQSLGSVVGQLGQGLGTCDTYTDRDAGALGNAQAQPVPEQRQVLGHARELSETFVDAVDLGGRHHRFDQRHHPLAHVAIQRVIATECHHTVPTEFFPRLKIRLAHFHEWLGVIGPGNDTTVVVAQHHDRRLRQIRPKYALTAGVERVAVDQRKYWLTAHDRGRYSAPRPK